MASIIQALPSEVVHLITAGEVIDSFAAVVRELVENSLDAGATRITVYLWPHQWRVRVTDNGRGMDLEDLKIAATAHSTSKISTCADLWKIQSLGFRGEALHSLTTLAELEILSRPCVSSFSSTKQDNGWRIVYGYEGEPIHIEPTALAPGTVVNVSNLFGSWTVRRQGLPNVVQQMKAVQSTIHQIALCHPHVAWQVWQNDRLWFKLSPATTVGQILAQIIPQVRPTDFQELTLELPPQDSASKTSNAPLHLLVGLPDRCHRHRPDWVRFAVNGRMVKSQELEQTIIRAFYRTLPRDRYPVCFLHLKISPDQIDWNRNPAKTEIYLKDTGYWQEQISGAIEQALRINPTTIKEAVHTTRVSKLLKAAEENGGYKVNNFRQQVKQQDENVTQHLLKAKGQINNTYIVAEHPGGVWLVEQHIVHERILYEQLCDSWQLIPVQPAVILYQLSSAQVSQLQHIGLDIEPFGEQLWAVRTIPSMLRDREDCAEAILELSWGGDLRTAQVSVACRTAIRNGTPLDIEEMQALLDQWQRTRNPHTCPHGRPIYLSLEEPALARFFRRSWVIGKSHGI